jgi:hypothetical protein
MNVRANSSRFAGLLRRYRLSVFTVHFKSGASRRACRPRALSARRPALYWVLAAHVFPEAWLSTDGAI